MKKGVRFSFKYIIIIEKWAKLIQGTHPEQQNATDCIVSTVSGSKVID